METAHARNALLDRKFYFRKDPFPHRLPRARHQKQQQQQTHVNGNNTSASASSSRSSSTSSTPTLQPVESEYELMTVADIINGSPDGFPGLIPLVESYLNSVNVDVETR